MNPSILNLDPGTGRVVTENDVLVNVIDPYGAVKTIDHTVAGIHAGNMFWHSSGNSLAGGASAYLLFITGTLPVHMVSNILKTDNAPVAIGFFESPTTSANGVALPVIAKNRQASNASQSLVYGGPTVSSEGTQLSMDVIYGANKEASSMGLPSEWLLKPSTKYLFKVTNNASQTLNYMGAFGWMEDAVGL
jgi:hypothetical protein